ncbi:PPC domain-containing protein, partial [Okeania sp. KiyG1]|uniref:PPC domain-containing protein n=1 Tax=Okeania sp. KiyG1 TaxID=2720165 RepID=UPI0019226C06
TDTILFQSTESGTRRETITEILEEGEYLVRVYSEGLDKTRYRLGLRADEITEEKDSIDTAKNLGILSPQEITELDEIGFGSGVSRDKLDYYKFSLEAESEVFLTLDQLKRNADVEILDSDGSSLLYQSTNGGRQQEKISETLEAGDYYIKVLPKGSAKTDYRLGISANEIINEDDDSKPGVDLGVLTPVNDLARRESIGRGQGNRRDVNDYYNFTVTSENQVSLTLDDLKANADIELYTSDDELIWRGENRGRQAEVFEDTLFPGNYTVRVFPKGNARTDYQLGITAQFPYVDDYANADEAFDFGEVTVDTERVLNEIGRTYRSQSGRDEQDWFRFELSEESNVNIDLRQLRANVDLTLYEDDGTSLLDNSRNTGRKAENINQTLDAGEYYVKVQPKGGARSNYQIAISAEGLIEEPQEFEIGNLSELETYSNNDRIGFTQSGVRNERDRYFFSLSEEGRVDVTLDQLRGNANLRVLDSQGSLMFDSRNPGRANEEVGEELEAGDYILEVFPQNAARTSYQLSVDFTSGIDDGNDTLPGEIIGELTQEEVIESEIGFSNNEDGRDQNDYYTFTLSEEKLVDISLNDLRANANVELRNSSGGLINRSNNGGRQGESITEELDAGEYSIRVYPQGGARTDYTLTVNPLDVSGDSDGTPPGEDIGTLGSFNVDDRIGFSEGGSRDQADYRKFTLEEDSEFSLNLTNLRQNADVELYDIDGTLLKRSAKGGRNNEAINLDLEAGEYYVGVLPKGSARTAYDLNMSASPIPDAPGTGDLGTLDSTSDPLTGGGVLIASSSSEANYTFELAETDFVTVTLDDLRRNANLELYGSDGRQLLGSSSNSGTDAEEIEVFLEADTYLVRVLGQGQATSFDLSVALG